MGSTPFRDTAATTLVRLGRRLGLDRTVGLCPPLAGWLKRQRRKVRARQGYRTKLVPEAELERSYTLALERLIEIGGPAGVGDYLEFGVCHGTSLMCMHRVLERMGLDHVRLYGFDSFEGLPDSASEDDGGMWKPGQFDSDYQLTRALLTRQGVDWDRVTLVKGWYSDTLGEDLLRSEGIERAGVIMIDCDMYLSAKEALDFCAPLIRDQTVLVFDDWHEELARRNMGEKRAFDEMLHEHPHLDVCDELTPYSGASRLFLVAARNAAAAAQLLVLVAA